MKWDRKHFGLFVGGFALGTAGLKILSSEDAKKVYSHCTRAVIRAKNYVEKTAAVIVENAEDIYATAKNINSKRVHDSEDEEQPEE